MSLLTAQDVPLLITSDNARAERRVSPAWTVAMLKQKLESVTGIPPAAQRLVLRVPGKGDIPLATEGDDEGTPLVGFGLQPYAEILVRGKTSIFYFIFLIYLFRIKYSRKTKKRKEKKEKRKKVSLLHGRVG
jgi:hypothetical protein